MVLRSNLVNNIELYSELMVIFFYFILTYCKIRRDIIIIQINSKGQCRVNVRGVVVLFLFLIWPLPSDNALRKH